MSVLEKETDVKRKKPTDKELNKVRVVSRQKDAQEFVKALEKTLKSRSNDLYSLDYLAGEQHDNRTGRPVGWLYVTYKNGSQKRVRLTSESSIGIMIEFANEVKKAEYLREEDKLREFLPE